MDIQILPRIIYPDPEIEREEIFDSRMSMIDPKLIFDMMNSQNTQPLLDERVKSNGPNNTKQPALPKIKKFLQSNIHISLLVILTYGLIATETSPTENVFLLFLLWELAEIFLLRTYVATQTSFLTILLFLAGIQHSTVILKWFELVKKVLNDLAIFLFFFVLVHISWELCVN